MPDDEMTIDDFGNPQYSGVYFRQLYVDNMRKTVVRAKDNDKILKFTQGDLPLIIYTGTMKPCATGMNFSSPEKLIYNNGVYFDFGQDEKPTY
jgi:hypothetical protein